MTVKATPANRGHAQRFTHPQHGVTRSGCSCNWQIEAALAIEQEHKYVDARRLHHQHKIEALGTELQYVTRNDPPKRGASATNTTGDGTGAFDKSPAGLRKAYMTVWALFGASSKEVGIDLNIPTAAATRLMRELENRGCITEQHVNDEKEITWQVTFKSIDEVDEAGAWAEITEKLGLTK